MFPRRRRRRTTSGLAERRCGILEVGLSCVGVATAGPTFDMQESDGAGGVHRLALVGELDMAVCDQVAKRLSLLAEDSSSVLLDLSRLEFIDSAGVQVLVLGLSGARERGCRVRVDRGDPGRERVIELTGSPATSGRRCQ